MGASCSIGRDDKRFDREPTTEELFAYRALLKELMIR